jgi:hypothetical protein
MPYYFSEFVIWRIFGGKHCRARFSNIGRQGRRIETGGIPYDGHVDAVVCVSKLIVHAADIIPRVARYGFCREITQAMASLGNPLQTSFYGVARHIVRAERRQIQVGKITLDTGRVGEAVVPAVRRIGLRAPFKTSDTKLSVISTKMRWFLRHGVCPHAVHIVW